MRSMKSMSPMKSVRSMRSMRSIRSMTLIRSIGSTRTMRCSPIDRSPMIVLRSLSNSCKPFNTIDLESLIDLLIDFFLFGVLLRAWLPAKLIEQQKEMLVVAVVRRHRLEVGEDEGRGELEAVHGTPWKHRPPRRQNKGS